MILFLSDENDNFKNMDFLTRNIESNSKWIPWKYAVYDIDVDDSILMEWSFGDSCNVDLFALVDDNVLLLFFVNKLSVDAALESVACNWLDFGVSENVVFGF